MVMPDISRMQSVFRGEENSSPPFWFMRQAGRYLPEYREVRTSCGDFLNLCYDPQKAAEVTLQPIRRFGMDAAIIFSDILVVPHAMGMEVGFVAGEGPKLSALKEIGAAQRLKEEVTKFLSPVYAAIENTRKQLPAATSLIGFAGAPWTLACYMLEGGGGGEFTAARNALYEQPKLHDCIRERLVESIAQHLIQQVKAGCDVLQLFDSWAGLVPADRQKEAIFDPTRRIVEKVKSIFPDIPIIGFPRGMGGMLGEYVRKTGVDGVSVDTSTPLALACNTVPENCVIQGNLDPLLLAASREETLRRASEIKQAMQGRKFIFNLGHGIVPHTPVEHVAALSAYLRDEETRACA